MLLGRTVPRNGGVVDTTKLLAWIETQTTMFKAAYLNCLPPLSLSPHRPFQTMHFQLLSHKFLFHSQEPTKQTILSLYWYLWVGETKWIFQTRNEFWFNIPRSLIIVLDCEICSRCYNDSLSLSSLKEIISNFDAIFIYTVTITILTFIRELVFRSEGFLDGSLYTKLVMSCIGFGILYRSDSLPFIRALEGTEKGASEWDREEWMVVGDKLTSLTDYDDRSLHLEEARNGKIVKGCDGKNAREREREKRWDVR